MAGASIMAANIAAIYIESFLYGLFFILSMASIYLIMKYDGDKGTVSFRRPTSILKRPMLLGTILLFLIITTHFVLTFVRFFQAFIYFRGGSQPEVFFNSDIEMTEIVQIGFFLAGLVVSDTMFTYRLWVIWNHNIYVVIFPICTVIALTVCSVGITYQFTLYNSPEESTYLLVAARWILGDCVFTLCTNVYCTSMIAWRIWNIHKSIRESLGNTSKRRSLIPVINTFVESAALCTTWTIFYFVSYEVQSNLHDFVEGTWATISGIAFTLITVRIGLGWSTPTDTTVATTSRQIRIKPPRFAARSAISTTGTDSFPMDHHHQSHVIHVSTGGEGDLSPIKSETKRSVLTNSTSDMTAVV